MRVQLLRRWGSHQAGDTVDVDNTTGHWLLDHALGETSSAPAHQAAAAPGTDGADPVISGDATRRRGVAFKRTTHNEGPIGAVAGSPTQYNAGVADESDAVKQEGGEDPARGEVSSQHEPKRSSTRQQTGKARRSATPES